MIPSNRLSQNSVDYESVPDDPADWASMMQQWTKIRNSVPNNNKSDLPTSPFISKPVKSDAFEPPISERISKSIKSEDIELSSTRQILESIMSEIGELPKSGQMKTVKSEAVELPKSRQILGPVKSEAVEVPKSPLERLKSEPVELPKSPQILEPVKSEVVEAPSLNGVDCGEAPKNLVAGVHCSNTSKEEKLPSKIRKSSSKKKKKKHKEEKAKRSREIKSDERSKKSEKKLFSPAFVTRSRLINPFSNVFSSQKNTNGTSLIRKAKDEIMEKSMLKVKQILTDLLMNATENQVSIIADEELQRAKSIAQSVRKKFSVLSSLSGKLGLKIYDSDDSDNSERKRNKMNQLESDEELQILIEQRQRNFEKTEMQIDLEIESRAEKEKSIAYQNHLMRKACVTKNEFERNGVDKNRRLKSTHRGTNNIKSKISKVVPKYQNLTVSSGNQPDKQHPQIHCQQKKRIQSTIKRNGSSQNLEKVESIREDLSSSSSTLSPSSLSSTTSWTSESGRSPHSSYKHSYRSDSDCNSDYDTRPRSRIMRTNTRPSSSKTEPYSKDSISPSKEYRAGFFPRNRRSINCEEDSSLRYASSYRIGDSLSRFRNRRSVSRSRSGRKSYHYCSDSGESRPSSCRRARR